MSMDHTGLAAALKTWRGCTPERPRGTITQREAAEIIGLPYDTLREIERSGTFRYPRLLINAIAGAVEARKRAACSAHSCASCFPALAFSRMAWAMRRASCDMTAACRLRQPN